MRVINLNEHYHNIVLQSGAGPVVGLELPNVDGHVSAVGELSIPSSGDSLAEFQVVLNYRATTSILGRLEVIRKGQAFPGCCCRQCGNCKDRPQYDPNRKPCCCDACGHCYRAMPELNAYGPSEPLRGVLSSPR